MLIGVLLIKLLISIYLIYLLLKLEKDNRFTLVVLFLFSAGIIQQLYYTISSSYKMMSLEKGYIGFFINKVDLGMIMPLVLTYLVYLYLYKMIYGTTKYLLIITFIGICIGLSEMNVFVGATEFHSWKHIHTAISCSGIFYMTLILGKYIKKKKKGLD